MRKSKQASGTTEACSLVQTLSGRVFSPETTSQNCSHTRLSWQGSANPARVPW